MAYPTIRSKAAFTTAVQLLAQEAVDQPFSNIVIIADPTNSGTIFIGTSSSVAIGYAGGVNAGIPLTAGASISLPIDTKRDGDALALHAVASASSNVTIVLI